MNEHLRAGHIHTPLGLMIAIVNAAGGMVRLDFEDDYRIDREEMNARTARDDDAVSEPYRSGSTSPANGVFSLCPLRHGEAPSSIGPGRHLSRCRSEQQSPMARLRSD